MEENADEDMLPSEQFAYRRRHSCEDCLALGVSRWMAALDKGQYCGIMLVDMSKAFDRVKHDILLHELRLIGVRDVPLAWFSSYLSNRKQHILFL